MSEPERQPCQHPDAPPKPKQKVGFKHKMALLEVIERKRLTDKVDYKAVGARHNVKQMYLRQLYSKWSRGMIDLGEPETPQELQIDARMQHEKMLILLKRYKAMILTGFEGLLFQAEDDMTNGNAMAWKEKGLPAVLNELRSIAAMQTMHEKGYSSVLDDLSAHREREMKSLNGGMTMEADTKIIHANEEDRALAAMISHER